MQALVDRHRQFVDNTLTNGKPVKFTQDGRDVIKLPRSCNSFTDKITLGFVENQHNRNFIQSCSYLPSYPKFTYV